MGIGGWLGVAAVTLLDGSGYGLAFFVALLLGKEN